MKTVEDFSGRTGIPYLVVFFYTLYFIQQAEWGILKYSLF